MKTTWLETAICYDGTQLCSHWIYRQTGILGDAIAGFIGPADVPVANMVDLADVRDNAPIFSRQMLHVIAEHFDGDLALAVARQRLLAAIAADALRRHEPSIERRGDDVMCRDKKLSVSIATVSPVSALIHFAVNVDSSGTPVPTLGLADLEIEPRAFGEKLLARYAEEIASMHEALCKVRAVP